MNTERRKLTRNSFEKNFYKLMNHSIIGKTMDNVRCRKTLNWFIQKENEGDCCKAKLHSFTIVNEDLVAAHCSKSTILLNKPIFCWFCDSWYVEDTDVQLPLRLHQEVWKWCGTVLYGCTLYHVRHQVGQNLPRDARRQPYVLLHWLAARSSTVRCVSVPIQEFAFKNELSSN